MPKTYRTIYLKITRIHLSVTYHLVILTCCYFRCICVHDVKDIFFLQGLNEISLYVQLCRIHITLSFSFSCYSLTRVFLKRRRIQHLSV